MSVCGAGLIYCLLLKISLRVCKGSKILCCEAGQIITVNQKG